MQNGLCEIAKIHTCKKSNSLTLAVWKEGFKPCVSSLVAWRILVRFCKYVRIILQKITLPSLLLGKCFSEKKIKTSYVTRLLVEGLKPELSCLKRKLNARPCRKKTLWALHQFVILFLQHIFPFVPRRHKFKKIYTCNLGTLGTIEHYCTQAKCIN